MNKQEFYQKFKEELDILFNSAAVKADRTFDAYWSGRMDGIESVEKAFDKLWREFEKDS